jgi:hypothetical protein
VTSTCIRCGLTLEEHPAFQARMGALVRELARIVAVTRKVEMTVPEGDLERLE